MGAELYPPKGMNYEDWLCDLMCGTAEEDIYEKEEESNDRTEQAKGTIKESIRG